jgi:hypothetical protein
LTELVDNPIFEEVQTYSAKHATRKSYFAKANYDNNSFDDDSDESSIISSKHSYLTRKEPEI